MTAATQNHNQNGHAKDPGRDLAVVRRNILGLVTQYADSIAKLAPRGMLPEYYVEELRLYLSQPDKDGNPSKLYDCDPVSIARGILRVAQTGLSLGVSCDLLPFKRACVFNPRYTGIIELALQSGVRAVNADVVYDDDTLFEYQKGTEFYLRHKPGPRKGNITHFYAMGELKPGSFVFVVMTKEEVEQFKKEFSKQWANTPIEQCIWYGIKTLIRQLSKFLPKNGRFTAALQFDHEEPEEIEEGTFEEVLGGPEDEHNEDRASLVASAAPAGPLAPCTKEQRERLLDLIEHPVVQSDIRTLIIRRLNTGLPFSSAKAWIEEFERVIAAESAARQEAEAGVAA